MTNPRHLEMSREHCDTISRDPLLKPWIMETVGAEDADMEFLDDGAVVRLVFKTELGATLFKLRWC